MTEKFVMVSLADEKAKILAEIISNKTSRKILDFLSTIEEASASDIAQHLQVPLNTIHYNIQNILKSGLIECKEFKWSKKGREINLYKIAKKHIIISPKNDTRFQEKIKSLFIVTGLSAIATFIVKKYIDLQTAIPETAMQQAKIAMDVSPEEIAKLPVESLLPLTHNVYMWFLLGALFAIIIYTVILWRKEVP